MRSLVALMAAATLCAAVSANGVVSRDKRDAMRGAERMLGNVNGGSSTSGYSFVAPTAITGSTRNGQTFTGVLVINRIVAEGDHLVAEGRVSGVLSGNNKNKKNNKGSRNVYDQHVRIPLRVYSGPSKNQQHQQNQHQWGRSLQAVCPVLFLELGPITLELLGLEVFVDVIVIEIVANPAGGLLGDLLCAIAGLLSGGGLLADIAALLNSILGALAGIGAIVGVPGFLAGFLGGLLGGLF